MPTYFLSKAMETQAHETALTEEMEAASWWLAGVEFDDEEASTMAEPWWLDKQSASDSPDRDQEAHPKEGS